MRLRPRLLGLVNLFIGLICTVGFSFALRPTDCHKWIQTSTFRERPKYTKYCPTIPYHLIATSTTNLVNVTSAIQELDELPSMLRAAENFWGTGHLVDKNSLLAYLRIEHTNVLRVLFANFVHITHGALVRLDNIATVELDELSIRLRMLLICRESEFLQNYFRELLPNIDAFKTQVTARIGHIQFLLKQLQRIKARVPRDAISDASEKNSTASFQVALPWYHWRTMAEVGRRKRKHELEKIHFTVEYLFRVEKKLESVMKFLETIEDKVLSRSEQEIEIYWDCRSGINAEAIRSDIERRILQSDVAMLKAESEKLENATATWGKANSNQKGHLGGFAFSLAGTVDEVVG